MAVPFFYVDSGARIAFHETHHSNIESIQRHGIQPTADVDSDTEMISEILDDLGYRDPFPFDRNEVVYCYVDGREVAETRALAVELTKPSVVFVIDLEQITAPMYLADMSTITDLIDYRCAGPEIMYHCSTPDEAVAGYQESITPVADISDIASYDPPFGDTTELIVDGLIPSDAIFDLIGTPE